MIPPTKGNTVAHKIIKSEDAWRAELSPDQLRVLRQELETERQWKPLHSLPRRSR